jgi:hypothetical protein
LRKKKKKKVSLVMAKHGKHLLTCDVGKSFEQILSFMNVMMTGVPSKFTG